MAIATAPTRPHRSVAVFVWWIAAAAILLPFAPGLERRLDASTRVSGSDAARTEAVLARDFDTPFANPVILVIEGLNPARGADEAETLAGLVSRLQAVAAGVRTVSYLDQRDPLFLGADGASTIVLIDPTHAALEQAVLVQQLRAAAGAYFETTRSPPRLRWTSESMVNDELREMSARDANAAELRVLPLALIVLLVAFGSATAGMAPLAMAFLTVALARGALALIDTAAPLSVLTANVATMLGLGLSIDYALLIVSRFREELAHAPPGAAAAATAASAGRTVLLSGLGVGIALTALVLVPISEVRSIAVAGLVVVAIAVAISATLLPPLLALAGSRVDALLPVRRRLAAVSDRFWRAWARTVSTRPLALMLVAGAPLLALALQCARLDISLPRGHWLPHSARAAEAMDGLDRIGRTGLLQVLRVTARLDAPDGASSERGWRAISELTNRIAVDPRVEATRSIVSLAGADGWKRLEYLPTRSRDLFLSRDERSALIVVVPRAGLELHELSHLVRDLRAVAGGAGVAELSIGGPPALTADYIDTVSRWFTAVAVCILGVTSIVLAIGLRSILLPLKAVALNLLSVAAAIGAMTLVFQDGVGAQFLGLPGPYHAVFPIIPILVFSIVFGLSMDYEVFLFSRIVELHRNGATNLEAMTDGLRATAGVITSAAVLMIVVFGAFTMGEFLLMKMLGFSLAVAIFIDAVLIRLVLGPALFALAGRWNWWPFAVTAAPLAASRARSVG